MAKDDPEFLILLDCWNYSPRCHHNILEGKLKAVASCIPGKQSTNFNFITKIRKKTFSKYIISVQVTYVFVAGKGSERRNLV